MKTCDCGVGNSSRRPRELEWWKRPLDLLSVALTLPLWGPAMIVVALWITLVSKGPLIYWQERIGFRGKRFAMFKFRSMKLCAETESHDAPMTKLDAVGNSRLIPLGAFLRAAGLDELPQIFNVIRGEMSLVGPAPKHHLRRGHEAH